MGLCLQFLHAGKLEGSIGLLQYLEGGVELESGSVHLVRTGTLQLRGRTADSISASAASLVELIEDGHHGANKETALELMDQIPKLTKKIAGKSLPIEKLCSRKARKFHSQDNRLFLPAMELAYVFGSLSHTPRRSLLQTHLPRIDKMLAKLEGVEPAQYGNGHGYWDGTSR